MIYEFHMGRLNNILKRPRCKAPHTRLGYNNNLVPKRSRGCTYCISVQRGGVFETRTTLICHHNNSNNITRYHYSVAIVHITCFDRNVARGGHRGLYLHVPGVYINVSLKTLFANYTKVIYINVA